MQLVAIPLSGGSQVQHYGLAPGKAWSPTPCGSPTDFLLAAERTFVKGGCGQEVRADLRGS